MHLVYIKSRNKKKFILWRKIHQVLQTCCSIHNTKPKIRIQEYPPPTYETELQLSQTRLLRTISAPGWSTSVILLRIPWVSEQGLVFHNEGKQSLVTILHKTHLNKYIFKFWVKTFCAIDKFLIFKTLNKTSELPKCWSLLPKSLC